MFWQRGWLLKISSAHARPLRPHQTGIRSARLLGRLDHQLGNNSLLLQIANLFVFKTKRWAMAVVAVVLTMSAYAVLHVGHYGAQLVHIEGIGPQGKYLEMEHHH